MGRVLCFFASLTVFTSISVSAQVNTWVNPTSGKWEDPASWSRGTPPASSQTVTITNPGFKAVNVDSATVAGSPGTLTIDNLAVSGPTNGFNTLLLNFAGAGTPLKVLNTCNIGTNAVIENLSSSFELDGNAGGQLLINGGAFTQIGGVAVVNAPVLVENGSLNDTNGNLTLGNVTVSGAQFAQTFNQDGGSIMAQSMTVTNGTYTMASGTLYALGGTEIGSFGQFVQRDGTNYGDITVNANNPGSYTIDGGLAQGNVLTVNGSFFQGGGLVNMQTIDWTGNNGNVLTLGTMSSQVLNVHGNALFFLGEGNIVLGNVDTASMSVSNSAIVSIEGYNLTVTNIIDLSGDATNAVARLEVQGTEGTTSAVSFGTVNLWPNSFMQESFATDMRVANSLNLAGGQFVLSGGTLDSLGIYVGPNSTFTQNGGQNYMNDYLTITGGTYEETSGYAIMDGLNLHGTLLLDANPFPIPFSFTNNGTVDFAGYLGVGMTNNWLGQVQLSSNATVAFIGTPAQVNFAASSGESWLPGVLMVVSNWNNSGSTHLFFGTDASGLSASQLSQIQFYNPVGLAPGVYTAKILSTGEVVPDQVVSSTSGTLNSWINRSSGNWGDPTSWSLGIVPGSSQSIFIANPSFKAVTINSATVSSAPQSLAVNSVAITSQPSGTENTFNTLLLNFAGAGNPLVIGVDTNSPGSLFVDSNSAVAMFSSGLIVNDALGETNSRFGEFEVDGTFNQSDESEVVAGFLDLKGTYNFTNGNVFIGTQFINGAFNQDGGTNLGAVVLSTNGDYELFDGAVQGNIMLSRGVFEQLGGTVSARLNFFGQSGNGGLYKLTGGMLLPGSLDLGSAPVTNDLMLPGGFFEQSGGTNNPSSLTVGLGIYYLSNGVVTVPTMTLTTNFGPGGLEAGDFEQFGGYVTNGGLTMIGGTNVDNHNVSTRVAAKYNLNPGILITPSITMDVADFGHAEGTNIVGTLSMNASIYFMQGGGLLEANQIQLTGGSQFVHDSGSVSGTPNLTMANGLWGESSPGVQLGQLQVSSGNSVLNLASASTVVQFADSSSAAWAGDGVLTIQGWNGSLSGGGAQQVTFGTSSLGLTAQQLSQVQFSNPGGLPAGTYAAEILSDGEVIPNALSSSSGPVNSWTNSASGNWASANWSLGILPNSSQTVLIANPGSKTVSINATTPVDFPGSMTVSNLFIEGATNTQNTLVLNNSGIGLPLTVINALTLKDNAQIVSINSGLYVQYGTITVTNSQLNQDGGYIDATNAMKLQNSVLNVTNGAFNVAKVFIGNPTSSRFNQYGGTVNIGLLGFSSYGGTNLNGYWLYGGMLNLPGGMGIYGESGGASYFQSGGTNYTSDIVIEPDYGGLRPGFTLNGGLLADSSVKLVSGYKTSISIDQNGGSQLITNSLLIEGSSANGFSTDPATYNMNGGTLSAGVIELNADEGDSLFVQSNATVFAGTVYTHSAGYFSGHNTHVTLSGGTLTALNYTNIDGNGTLNQSGGALVVSNLLTFGGSRDVGIMLYGTYTLTGGTLSASNIDISGIFNIGDGTSNRITNPGAFTLSHLLQISNAVEQLGHFVLAGTNATISLAGSASHLSFANSSGEAWTGGATLSITGWNGNASGGGAEQLRFGTDQSGLTAAQLSQIQFDIGTNVYSAKILASGEVVPNTAVGPSVNFSTQGNNFVLNWPGGWTLQSATNVLGPYTDVPGATSPFTNDMTLNPQLFFRLRQ